MSGQDKHLGQNDNLIEEQIIELSSQDTEISGTETAENTEDLWDENSLARSVRSSSSKVNRTSHQKTASSTTAKGGNTADLPYFDWLDFSLEDEDEAVDRQTNQTINHSEEAEINQLIDETIVEQDRSVTNEEITTESEEKLEELIQLNIENNYREKINHNVHISPEIPIDLDDLDDLLEEPANISSLSDSENLLDRSNTNNALDDLDDLLEEPANISSLSDSENSLDRSNTNNALDDLDDLLEEPANISSLSDSENSLDRSNTNNALDDLDDLLEEPANTSSLSDSENSLDRSNTNSAFDDLESLIGDEEENIFNQLTNETTAQKPVFSDLDQLLEESVAIAYAPASQIAPEISLRAKPSFATDKASVSNAQKAKGFEQTMRVPVKTLDNLNNLIGELVVKRNRLEEDQERLRQFLDNLLNHVQSLNDVGGKMQDVYERSLLEGALAASRQQAQASANANRNPYAAAQSSLESTNNHSKNSQDDDELSALEMDRFTGFHLLSQDIMELIVRVRESSSDIQFLLDETDKVTQNLRQVTNELQEGINSSRMIAFEQTADRLPRAVRDICVKLKKQADLVIEGKNVSIDKMIVEHLYNPMTHLINNAMTHGIESPEERIQKGKSPTGTITVSADIQGNQTVISVSDDGAGIDPERVKAKAIEKGLLFPEQAAHLSEQDVYEFLFHPGFSTRDKADDFAGRGVGMDVVKTDLKKIRGTVSIDSTLGKGTVFTIRLPLLLSISKALSCFSNHTRIAFPIDGVEDTREYTPQDIQLNAQGLECIPWRNTLLPFQPLRNLLSYNRQIRRGTIYGVNKDDDTISIVILRSGGNLLAIQVDRVVGEQEVVIKQIEGPIPKPAGIAGATILGDGSIMGICDVLELIEIAQGRRNTDIGPSIWNIDKSIEQEPKSLQTEPLVLVVDDSITVRELLTLSFNKLGYRVEQARDGQEAWDKLRSGLPCDMIFCDIEMPRMNGLELLSNLQKEDNLKDIPVAMLTSRGADKHRKLATDLGANAYLTKPYTEKDLIDVAQRFINKRQGNSTSIDIAPKPSKLEPSKTVETISSRPPQAEEKEKSNRTVLIIDDSVTVRELLSMTFRKAGYQIEQARDGQEALDKLQAGLMCDVAFCDIEMPRMNGLELLSRLQQDEKLSALPIAMLTSRGAKKMRNMAAKRGAKGYFVKPYVEETLLDAAQKLMSGETLIEAISLDELDREDD